MTPEPHDAMLWEAFDDQKVRCLLCGHQCIVAAGSCGLCRVRQNVAGVLKSLNYDTIVAINADPIEKKPLFHFLPGTRSLSIAAPGCNFQCDFCQNWGISQSPRTSRPSGQNVTPEQIVAAAVNNACPSISYTYTEPTVFFELAYDTGRLAHQRGLKNCFVSNGYMTARAVEEIRPYLDAVNVDLKAFRDRTYRNVMKATLEPVLVCLRALVAAEIWVEVTTLVVPGMNDSAEELGDIARFIAGDLGPSVPWHVSRFHPDYKMSAVGSTPIERLELACGLGKEAGLKHVYCGNVPGQTDERTYCPSCGEVLIDRTGFSIRGIFLKRGACPSCSEGIAGAWDTRA